MAKINIDFGGSNCAGRCEHCRFGSERAALSQGSAESLQSLRRLIEYASNHGDSVRVSYVTPFSAIVGELPMIAEKINIASICFSTPEEIEQYIEVVLEKLKFFKGEAVTLAVNHYPISEFSVDKHMPILISAQHALFSLLPGLKEVFVTLNHNTSAESVEVLKRETFLATYAFVHSLEKVFKTSDFGDNQVVITGRVDSITTQAMVRLGGVQFGFACRYITPLSATDHALAARLEPSIKSGGDLALAVLDVGVHVDHSTSIINNPRFWFSHQDFGELIDLASGILPLAEVCREALRKRQTHNIKTDFD